MKTDKLQIIQEPEKRLTKYNPSIYSEYEKKFPEMKMKRRMATFCEEYIFDFNGTRACRVAGYKGKNIFVTASKLLRNTKIYRLSPDQSPEKFRDIQREVSG